MRKTMTRHEIIDGLTSIGQFSYNGAVALAEYLENLEFEMGEELEYDPVAFRCEYAEYANFEEFQNDYPDFENMEDLRDYTIVIDFNGGFIIGTF
jgi:hypothetical protein